MLTYQANVNARDVESRTPLVMAAMFGHADVMWVLLQHGAVAAASVEDREKALAAAVRCNGHSPLHRLQVCDWRLSCCSRQGEAGATDIVDMLTAELEALGGQAPAAATPAAAAVPGPEQMAEIVAAVEAALCPKIEAAVAAAVGGVQLELAGLAGETTFWLTLPCLPVCWPRGRLLIDTFPLSAQPDWQQSKPVVVAAAVRSQHRRRRSRPHST